MRRARLLGFGWCVLAVAGCQAFLVFDDDDAPTDASADASPVSDASSDVQSTDATLVDVALVDGGIDASDAPFCDRGADHALCADFESTTDARAGWQDTDLAEGGLELVGGGFQSDTALLAHGNDVGGLRIAALKYDMSLLPSKGATIEVSARVKCPPPVRDQYLHVLAITLEKAGNPSISVHAACKRPRVDGGPGNALEVNTTNDGPPLSAEVPEPLADGWNRIVLSFAVKPSWDTSVPPGTAAAWFLQEGELGPASSRSASTDLRLGAAGTSMAYKGNVRVGLQYLDDSNAYPVDVFVDDVTIDTR